MDRQTWHYVRDSDGSSLYLTAGADGRITLVTCGRLGNLNDRQKLHFRRKLLGIQLEKIGEVLRGSWQLRDVFQEDEPIDLFEKDLTVEEKLERLRRMVVAVALRVQGRPEPRPRYELTDAGWDCVRQSEITRGQLAREGLGRMEQELSLAEWAQRGSDT